MLAKSQGMELAHFLHPVAAGAQAPHDPPRPSGHVKALVIAGDVAVTVIVEVLIVGVDVVGGFAEIVTKTVEVEVVSGWTVTVTIVTVSI